MKRRSFLKQASLLATSTWLAPYITHATGKKNPVIMVVSGWQDVNIGDITHTPGLIGLLKRRLPNARIILWKKSDSKRVDDMLQKYFPDLTIIHGKIDKNLNPLSKAVQDAFNEADFFIHGSGPSVVAADYIRSWYKNTHKSFGIFGVTIQDIDASLKELLLLSTFIFTRETASIAVLNKHDIKGSHIGFAPDATFVLDIHDDAKGNSCMKDFNLEVKKFICVIPRLRYTPYWEFADRSAYSEQRIKELEAVNSAFKEKDHLKLREAIIVWVRKTGNNVLVCPEMTYQFDIMDELIIDPLPDDVKPFVKKRGYWMPDEAASVYARAHAVVSFECHSPIIAAANGTPCFYLRQPTDTIKGQMYYDLGFNDWVFEIDETTAEEITNRLMNVYNDYPAALLTVKKAIEKVNERYDESFTIIKKHNLMLS